MTLPEWVDPSSPDDPRAGGANEEGLPTPGTADPLLATKPILEWTHEDWARWVAGGTAGPATDVRPVPEGPERAAVAEPAGGTDQVDDRPGEEWADWDEGPDTPIVDIRLPEEDGSSAGPTSGVGPSARADDKPAWWDPPLALLADADESAGAGPAITLGPEGWGREAPAGEPAPTSAPERSWDEPAEVTLVAPAGDEGVVEEAERPWDEPPGVAAVAQAGDEGVVEEAERPWDEPPGVAAGSDDRPWDDEAEFDRRAAAWAQEPPVPQGRIFGAAATSTGAVAGQVDDVDEVPLQAPRADEPAVSALPLDATGELPPPPPAWPPEELVPSPRPLGPGPRASVARGLAGAGRLVDDEPHRLRSAVGLLMLAVTLGVILAALVTATVVAIGLALRQLSA